MVMGFITSLPTPVAKRMGISPIMSAITVISFGRTRITAPEKTAV
jgi:hypothetical protein